MKCECIKFSLLILLFGFQFTVVSQPSIAKVRTISMATGLDGLAINQFFLDNDKKIWIQTETSINICSGLDIEVLSSVDQLSSPNILERINDRKGYVELYYRDEFQFFDKWEKMTHQVSKHKLDLDSTINWMTTLMEKDSSLSYIGYKKSDIYVFNYDTKYLLKFNFNHHEIKEIIGGNNGYWIKTHDEKIVQIKMPGVIKYLQDFPIESLKVCENLKVTTVFYEDAKSRLWLSFAGKNGVVKKEFGSDEFHIYEPLADKETIVKLWEDKAGNLILGASHRLRFVTNYYLLKDNMDILNWHKLNELSTIPRYIKATDFTKSLYMGTYRDFIIVQFPPPYLNQYFKENVFKGDYGNIVRGIDSYSDSTILFSSEDDSLFIFNTYSKEKKLFLNLKKDHYFLHNEVDTINHFVWSTVIDFQTAVEYMIGWNENTSEFIKLPKKFDAHRFGLGKPGEIFFTSKDSNELVSIWHHNYLTNDFEQITILGGMFSFIKNIFNFYYDDENNTLYFLTRKSGLFWINLDDRIVHKIALKNFKEVVAGSISAGRNNELFISTGKGVFIIDKTQKIVKQHIAVKDGLSYPIVCNTIEDKNNNLWISTFSGLNFVDREKNIIINYYKEDGLPFGEFNRPSATISNDSHLYFGSGNGMVEVNLDVYYQNKADYSICFQKIFFRDAEIDSFIYSQPQKQIILQKDKNHLIEISLGNSDWGNFEKARYYYKVSGIDEKWKKLNGNKLTLERMDVGDFFVEFKSLSRFGIPSSNILNLKISIERVFYKSPYFYAILAMLASGFLIFKLTRNFVHRKNNKKRIQLEFEKKVSQLKLQALQAQMNPHFIFNSISAIQQYLVTNDVKSVEHYLNEFGLLMRLILESSKSSFISLEKEIQLIGLYTRLEKVRFKEKFDISIEIDEDIDSAFIEIPTMIIQPFIENAINHGLFHKDDGKGYLDIKFIGKGENILVTIKDNGVGREEAQRIKNKSIHRHKSRAMQIIKERQEVLKILDNYNLSIEIIDLKTDQGIACGTLINLIIPESF